jgi:hypothetical protein
VAGTITTATDAYFVVTPGPDTATNFPCRSTTYQWPVAPVGPENVPQAAGLSVFHALEMAWVNS